MATIVSSVIVEDQQQRDLRRSVRERHIDNAGVAWFWAYPAEAISNAAAIMAARVPAVIAYIEQTEIDRNMMAIISLGRLAIVGTNVTLVYTTAAQNFTVLRELYRVATRAEVIMMADFLSDRTDAQLQTAFGMTPAQVTTLRSNKLTPARSLADSIRAAAGQ